MRTGTVTGYALPIRRLIEQLAKLPGVGEKTATRLAMYILHAPEEYAKYLAESIVGVKEKIGLCKICFNLSEGECCDICMDAARDINTICVVEEPDALIAIETTGSFRGTYHVLHGVISPLDGIGPNDLKLEGLISRLKPGFGQEIIIATNPNVQGEATAMLIAKLLKGRDVKVTRIAFGVPMGGDLKYTDHMTLSRALDYRRGV